MRAYRVSNLDAKLAEGECLLEDNLAHYVGAFLRLARGARCRYSTAAARGNGPERSNLAVGKREVMGAPGRCSAWLAGVAAQRYILARPCHAGRMRMDWAIQKA